MIVESFDVENSGMYKCIAKNNLGEVTKELSVTTKLAPIVEVVPTEMNLKEKDFESVKCNVKNTVADYKIHWIDDSGTKGRIVRQIQFVNLVLYEILFRLTMFTSLRHRAGITIKTSHANCKTENSQSRKAHT